MINQIIASLLGLSLIFAGSIKPLAAQLPLTGGEIESDGQVVGTVKLIDWEQISLSALGNIPSSGQIQLPDGQVIIWKQGDNLTSVLPISSFSEWLGLEQLTGVDIQALSGINWNQISLEDFSLLGKQTISNLIKIVPGLGQTSIEEILPIAYLFKSLGYPYSSKATLAQLVAKNPSFGQLKLNQLKEKNSLKTNFKYKAFSKSLPNFTVTMIPNIEQVAISSFEGWKVAAVNSVPGLGAVPLGSMPKPVTWPNTGFARIDFVYGEFEQNRVNTISGSDVEGFQVPCVGPCPYIELDDLENSGIAFRDGFEGKQWINGLYQNVAGGWGCLKWVNGGVEPTGRLPYGPGVKIVVTKTEETTDTVEMSAYLRICNLCGCTPYYLGPFPFQEFHVNDWIYIGF